LEKSEKREEKERGPADEKKRNKRKEESFNLSLGGGTLATLSISVLLRVCKSGLNM